MIRAYRTNPKVKFRLVYNEIVQLPPDCNLVVFEVKDTIVSTISTIKLRLIFSRQGKDFTVSVKTSLNKKFLDYIFYNWNSEEFVEARKPFTFTYKNTSYLFNFSTKINSYTMQRTIHLTLWAIS
jgi:hypothetical protein